MRFRFIGQYPSGYSSINACGVDFVGREPGEVTTADGIRRLSRHPEFEAVKDEPEPEVIAPVRKPRSRKPKVAE